MNEIFSQIWDYLGPILASIGTYLVVALPTLLPIIKKAGSKMIDKVDKSVDANAIANKVANKLANSEVKMSLESVNKKQLNQIEDRLTKTFKDMVTTVDNMEQVLVIIGSIMSKFKVATEEERAELEKAVSALSGKPVKYTEEPIVVKLDKIDDETKEVQSDLAIL